MNEAMVARLQAKGWVVGDAQDFLGLSDEEVTFIELKIALSRELRERRRRAGMTQAQLADRLHTSQSRIAKMEKTGSSLDLVVMALLSLGSTARELGRVISSAAS